MDWMGNQVWMVLKVRKVRLELKENMVIQGQM